MQIKFLSDVSIEMLYKSFIEAFADYLVERKY